MMCAKFLRSEQGRAHGRVYRASQRVFDWLLHHYETSLSWVLRHARLTLLVAAITVCVNVYLYMIVPKGFFPEQDTGRIMGAIQADQDTSFQALQQKLTQFVDIVKADPAVANVGGLHRRQPGEHQHRPDVHVVEAAGRTQAQRHPGHGTAAPEARVPYPAPACFCKRSRTCGSAAG